MTCCRAPGTVLVGSLMFKLLCVITTLHDVLTTLLTPLSFLRPLTPETTPTPSLRVLRTLRMVPTLPVSCMNERVTKLMLPPMVYLTKWWLPLAIEGRLTDIVGMPMSPCECTVLFMMNL